jgi:hypothetical protein
VWFPTHLYDDFTELNKLEETFITLLSEDTPRDQFNTNTAPVLRFGSYKKGKITPRKLSIEGISPLYC